MNLIYERIKQTVPLQEAMRKYLDGFALTTDILAEIDPTVKVNPIDPSAQIRAALSGKTTTAHVGTTVIPDFLYENNELDTTQLGDGKNVISVPSVLVKPSYMYSTSGFNSALLTPNNLTVSPNVTVSAKYTVDAVSNVLKQHLVQKPPAVWSAGTDCIPLQKRGRLKWSFLSVRIAEIVVSTFGSAQDICLGFRVSSMEVLRVTRIRLSVRHDMLCRKWMRPEMWTTV